jgi:hypothetical protein
MTADSELVMSDSEQGGCAGPTLEGKGRKNSTNVCQKRYSSAEQHEQMSFPQMKRQRMIENDF